jgi:hypothetical protein
MSNLLASQILGHRWSGGISYSPINMRTAGGSRHRSAVMSLRISAPSVAPTIARPMAYRGQSLAERNPMRFRRARAAPIRTSPTCSPALSIIPMRAPYPTAAMRRLRFPNLRTRFRFQQPTPSISTRSARGARFRCVTASRTISARRSTAAASPAFRPLPASNASSAHGV